MYFTVSKEAWNVPEISNQSRTPLKGPLRDDIGRFYTLGEGSFFEIHHMTLRMSSRPPKAIKDDFFRGFHIPVSDVFLREAEDRNPLHSRGYHYKTLR